MKKLALQARAKINLSLDVTGRRDNGYHDVRMIMQSIDLYDEIEISRTGSDPRQKKIVLVSETGDLPDNEDNLIYKAARLIMEEYDINEGVGISYKKNIPIAAGMAGGSSDAAAVLKGINILFDLSLSTDALCEMGVKIGADVPYCIMGGTALSEGIGEILTPLRAMPECFILVAKPDIRVSTACVYTAFDNLKEKVHPDVDAMTVAIEEGSLNKVAELLGNSLEGVTGQEYPVISKIEELMLCNGALGAVMSGSGPTVFGLFNKKEEAAGAGSVIKESGLAKDIIVTVPYNDHVIKEG
jgi:4-diphosphocytidyl-2-C-methyl-D-erythritol kinase